MAGQPDHDPSTDEDRFGQQSVRSSISSSVILIVTAVVVLALICFFFGSDLP
jgi:hypothetical protein